MKRTRGILRLPVLATLLLLAGQAQAVVNFGAVGDSLTDEYLKANDQAANDLAAHNWVQILAETRSAYVSFGAYRPSPTDNWGGSRDTGYEFNWAKSGAAASSQTRMNVTGFGSVSITAFGSDYASTQAAGLAGHISSGKVDTVFIGVGANDFYFRTNWLDMSGNATPIALADLNLPLMVTEVTNGILNAVDTALAAGNVRVLVAVVHVRDEAFTDARSVAITAAAQQVNANLAQAVAARAANGKTIAMVDLWGWAVDGSDPHHRNPDGSLTVGGLHITNTAASLSPAMGDLAAAGSPGASAILCTSTGSCATAQHATHATAEDGLHPNTVIQALLANQVIKALNANFGESIPVLSDADIESLVPAVDSDFDAIPNTTDADDDNDGVTDVSDNCPTTYGASPDQTNTDGDSEGDVCDLDDDNDGVPDMQDIFPLDVSESVDTDGDGIGNHADTDNDNDGVLNADDNCPLSPGMSAVQTDTDVDSAGDVCDNDDDGDGVADGADAFPLDAAESVDTDDDGTGNHADTDDDNDGVADTADNCPLSPGLGGNQQDADSDAAGDVCDSDDDNDGVLDASDSFPLNPVVSADADADGYADSWNSNCDAACQASAGIALDNCLGLANVDQLNTDGDVQGNACDADDDNDRVPDVAEIALGADPVNAGSGPELLTVISFENGVPANWSKPASANAGWSVSSSYASHLAKSLRTAVITHNQKAQIQMTALFYPGSFNVDYKLSTEANSDAFRIYLDGLGKLSRSGVYDWQTVAIPVAAGTHTVKFEYWKNGSISAGEDAVWIDRVSYIDGTDTDGDGQIDAVDADDDSDGLPDAMDPLPLSARFNLNGSFKGSAVRESQGF